MTFLETIKEEAKKLADSKGLILYDVKWLSDSKGKTLQISLDIADRPIDVDTCGEFSEEFNTILDNLNLIDAAYTLEVCSPGAEKELRNIEEIKSALNKYVYVKLKDPKAGIFEAYGDLINVNETTITLGYKDKTRNKELVIDNENISLIRLAVKI